MIVVRLNGGLGNQLFQYAAGRALAKQRGTVVKLDRTWVDADRKRSYALGAWNIPAAFVTAAYLGWLRLQNAVGHRVFPHAPYYRRAIVREQAMTFDVNVLRAPRTCVLEGYWQSEEYFLAVEPLIRREFTLREEPSSASRKIAQTILGENSIFVHIRRGDYVSESGTVAVHGTCSPDYYRRAAEYIAARVLDPHFFVFSDEPQWVSQHFHLPYRMSVVDHNSPGDSTAPGREHEDLWLMSLCKHAILANSSFSWWGAWLNPERERLVIAPKRWFQSLPHDTRDLIPQNWLRM